jgi:hypothetical protein
MHRNVRNALVALGVAVIVTPAAVSEGKERDAHGHGAPASVVEKKADRKARHEAKHGDKKVTYVFRGSYGADGVKVAGGNKHVRRAGLVGQTVAFDLSAARIVVADNNGDGMRDASDLRDGDKVLVEARLPRRDPGAAPFSARKLVDRTHAKKPAGDQPAGSDAPASTDG